MMLFNKGKKRIENKYVVSPEARVVVCNRVGLRDLIQDETERKCSPAVANAISYFIHREFLGLTDLPFKIELPRTFKGVAKCDERDEFDEKVGRDVARLIAKKKYHAAAARSYGRLHEFFLQAAKEMGELAVEQSRELGETEAALDKYKA